LTFRKALQSYCKIDRNIIRKNPKVVLFSTVEANNLCVPRDYGKGGTVCVCNTTYCDTFDAISKTSPGIVTVYESNKSGDRFKKQTLKFTNKSNTNLKSDVFEAESEGKTVTINRDVKYQKIIGFGGAFTDAASINILSLGLPMAERIINDYYSSNGLSYSMGRIPMAGCDFSTRKYTYDDNEGDLQMQKFNLTEEDLKFKVCQT
jgi:glucosylceramidase